MNQSVISQFLKNGGLAGENISESIGNTSVITDYHIIPLCSLSGPQSRLFAVILAVLSVLATAVNGLVLVIILRYKRLQTPSMMLVGALATIDLLTSCSVTPMVAVQLLRPHSSWRGVTWALLVVLGVLSLFTTVYISLDRFLSVYHLRKYKPSRKKLLSWLCCLWLVPFVCHSIVRAVINEVQGREAGRFAGRISVVVVIFACFAIISASYAGIVVMLRKHTRHVTRSVRHHYLANQSQAGKTSLLIIGVNLIMYFPAAFYVMNFSSMTSSTYCAITMTTILAIPLVNPLIYCFRTRSVQRHILVLFGMEQDLGERTLTRTASMTMEQNFSLSLDRKKLYVFIKSSSDLPLDRV